ncbi:Do family serine endopeptidase [Parvularcula marina]|nr:Do family serine endopeptidase [Parvularcula marina]
MLKSAQLRKLLVVSTAAFVLGGATVGSLMAQENNRPQAAKPQLMAPNPSFIQQLSFADLVEEVSPAVVSIRTEADVAVRDRMQLPPGIERMLPPELRDELEQQQQEEEDPDGRSVRRPLGQGSGFFINDQGHIVTNSHVIDGADEITVVLNNGDELTAELVGTDPATDLAVLKVEPSSEQRYVQFSEETDLRVGDYVLAVGNPFGLGGSVTSGIVSAMNRESNSAYANFIQIDASINRGNSGGPTFDLRGNVVGVNTAIISPTGGNVGIGLAVPANVATDIVQQLIDEGAVTRGWLGVGIGSLNDRLAAAVGTDSTEGALVQSVTEGSPAEKAGFEEGDVVLEFDRTPVADATSLTRIVGALPPGKKVKAKVLRNGEEKNLTVTLAKRDPLEARQASDENEESEAPAASEDREMSAGLTLSSLSDQSRRRLGLDDDVEGVLVSDVELGSEAAEAGFRRGMVLTRADNMPVKSVKDLEKALQAAEKRGKEAVLVRVQTGQQGAFFLAMPVEAADKG